jgi:hypothetical protein
MCKNFWTWHNPICQFLLLERVFPNSFKVLILWFILNWFLYRVRDREPISVFYMFPVSQHHSLKRHFLNIPFCQKSEEWVCSCGFVSASLILLHWSVCLFLCQQHAVFVTLTLYYNFNSGIVTPLVLWIVLAIQVLLFFHMNFWIL